jgi:CRISPR-associated protein Cas5h
MRNWVYAPTLGTASFQASIVNTAIYSRNQVIKKRATSERISFDSAIISDNVTELLFEKQGQAFIEEELLPADFITNYNRELKKMNRVLFTTAGIPLTVRLTDNYFIIRDRTGDQIIQFLH